MPNGRYRFAYLQIGQKSTLDRFVMVFSHDFTSHNILGYYDPLSHIGDRSELAHSYRHTCATCIT
jgi:hypothetical protein